MTRSCIVVLLLCKALCKLQSAFNVIQSRLFNLKLVLNGEKTKYMVFSGSKKFDTKLISLQTLQGSMLELVKEYKYLGIIVDDTLSFGSHIMQLKKKMKIKLGFYFRNKFCLSFNARKKLISATFLSVLDYGDVVYQFAPISILSSLDAVYHGALRFILNCKSSVHHCTLYKSVGGPSLSSRRKIHWYLMVYKAILGMLPSYLCRLIQHKSVTKYSLRSQNCYMLSVPFARTELGKKSFAYAALFDWNFIQSKLKLQNLPSFDQFKADIWQLNDDSEKCNCF